MPAYCVTVNVAAPAGNVWALVSDVLAWPEHLPTVTSVTPLAAHELEVGACFRVLQPKVRPATWKVTSVQPGRSFVWEAGLFGLNMWASHAVEPLGSTRCRLDLEFGFSGPLALFAGLFGGALARQYVATESATFKRLAEVAPVHQSG